MTEERPLYLYVLAGLVAGVLSGLFGVGGGFILVPMLTWLGLTQHKAHATSLAILLATSSVGAVSYYLHGTIDVPFALWLGAGSVAGVLIGTRVMRRIPARQLRIFFGVVLILVAIRMLIKIDATPHEIATPVYILGGLALGVVAGFLGGMLGAGGGFLTVPGMVLLLEFEQHIAQGVSLLAIIPTSAVGAYTQWKNNLVLLRVALSVAPGAAVGGIIGSELASRLASPYLQQGFALLLIIMSVRMILTAPKSAPKTAAATAK